MVIYCDDSALRLVKSGVAPIMASRESGNMERTQTTLDSTLESVDKAEVIAMDEGGFDGEVVPVEVHRTSQAIAAVIERL